MSKNSTGGTGIGVLGFMFLIFLTLKLCNVITWSWWWVTAPLWIPWGVILVCIGIYGLLCLRK